MRTIQLEEYPIGVFSNFMDTCSTTLKISVEIGAHRGASDSNYIVKMAAENYSRWNYEGQSHAEKGDEADGVTSSGGKSVILIAELMEDRFREL